MLAFSHCRGRKFETCIAHQEIQIKKHQAAMHGAFFVPQVVGLLVGCNLNFLCVHPFHANATHPLGQEKPGGRFARGLSR